MKVVSSHPAGRQRGATLIEVLIALLVLGVGLLGTAVLQVRAQQVELDSYQRSQALILAQDMINRISTNRRARGCYDTFPVGGGAGDNFVGTGSNPGACSGWGTLATRERADADLTEWTALLRGNAELLKSDDSAVGAMDGARGCINFNQVDNVFTVTVAWQGQMETVAPPGNTCAQDEYGDDALRRVVSLSIKLGHLD